MTEAEKQYIDLYTEASEAIKEHSAEVMNAVRDRTFEDFRRQGFARGLLAHVEAVARQRGCCKLTLEVLEGNHGARRAYLDFGFEGYQLDPAMGQALFMEKKLG